MTDAPNATTLATGTLSLDYLNSLFLAYTGLSAQYAVASQMQLVTLNSGSGIDQLAAATNRTASAFTDAVFGTQLGVAAYGTGLRLGGGATNLLLSDSTDWVIDNIGRYGAALGRGFYIVGGALDGAAAYNSIYSQTNDSSLALIGGVMNGGRSVTIGGLALETGLQVAQGVGAATWELGPISSGILSTSAGFASSGGVMTHFRQAELLDIERQPGRGESIASADHKVGHAMRDHSCGPRATADRARGRANKDRTFS